MTSVIDTIINFSESFKEKTIFDVLDDCIESAQNYDKATINVNWFYQLKFQIEQELRSYCNLANVPINWILKCNRVTRIVNGLKITNQSEDFTILKIYFPNEFNPNSVIIERCYL